MFSKVLLAEDIDSINIAVVNTLDELNIIEKDSVKYCDDALLKIKKALQDEKPYQLLLTDLSFKEDFRQNTLNSGEELIIAIKQLQPTIKVIVLSVEEKTYRIKSLFEHLHIDAFVLKGRNSMPELKKAIQHVFDGNTNYIAPNLSFILKDKMIHEIDNYDIQLIEQLSYGIAQEKMDIKFKELGVEPNSKSTIEKRIGKLKDYFKANNTVHLIAIAKDLGLI
ncbi:response regulator [Flavobacterium cellulosilyticum]|uniref:Response regulator transcription factor n=1 Tax=Flavobacterium cellulosilyticum TaxID=2541731 RepID=A0A4R5C5Z7_9FLAO|nr:response regulator transcription factor [Flavobacterium cellulosilyticum]TDD95181.1 response regulator transcription factor [Flavobacterium cellulosilyticum]